MNTTFFAAGERGHADHGWLNSYHTFSFASWHNPQRMHFGLLRVVNDDTVAASMGFGTHPHDNMEIVSIPLSGALKHSDSTGRTEIIRSGEVQIMSAGTGIRHSEMNASHSEPVKFLQIWVFPKEKNIAPRYEQRLFGDDALQGKFRTVVSPLASDDAVWINQDAWFSLGVFSKGDQASYEIRRNGNGAFVMLLEGSASIGGQTLNRRDAIGITDAEKFELQFSEDSRVLVIDVPMN